MAVSNLAILVKMSGGLLPPNSRAGDVEIYDNGRMLIFESDTDIVERMIDRQKVLDILQYAREAGFFQLPNIDHDTGASPNVPDVTLSIVDSMGTNTVTMTSYQRLRGEMRKSPFDLVYKRITDLAWDSYTNGTAPAPSESAQQTPPPMQSMPANQQPQRPPVPPAPAVPSPQVPPLPFSAQGQSSGPNANFELPSLDDLLKSSGLQFDEPAGGKAPSLPPLTPPSAPAPGGSGAPTLPPLPSINATMMQGAPQQLPSLDSVFKQQPPAPAPQRPPQPAPQPQSPKQPKQSPVAPAPPAPKREQPMQEQRPPQQPPAQQRQQPAPVVASEPQRPPIPPQQQAPAMPPKPKAPEQRPPEQRPEQRADERPQPVPMQQPPKQQPNAPKPRQEETPRQQERSPQERPQQASAPKQVQPERAEQPGGQKQQEQRQPQREERKPQQNVRQGSPNSLPPQRKPPVAWERTQESIERLEESLHGKVLVFYAANSRLVMEDMRYLYSHLRKLGRKKSLYVVPFIKDCDSTVVWRMATLLREFCEEMHVILPEESTMSTTMFALAADSILMNPFGFLSPIDTTFTHTMLQKTSDETGVPLSEIFQASGLPINRPGVKTKEEPSIMGDTAQNTFHPLITAAAARQFALTQRICTNLLKLSTKNKRTETEIAKIVLQLTQGYPSAQYPIVYFEAQTLGLPVSETNESVNDILWDLVKEYVYITQPVLHFQNNTKLFEKQNIIIESTGRRTIHYSEQMMEGREEKVIEEHTRWRELTQQISISDSGKENHQLLWKELQLVGSSEN